MRRHSGLETKAVGRLAVRLVCMVAILPAMAAHAATLSIAIIEYQDTWTNTKGLGESLADLGYGYTDLTDGLLAGHPLVLTGFNTFIIGSHAVQNDTLRLAIETAEPTLHGFVDGGGTCIMLTQADQNRADEDWLERPGVARRCDTDFSTVYRVQGNHQVFNSPNVISNADLSGWTYGSYAASWESFNLFRGVAVLAGNNATTPSLGTILEAGWGQGRALLVTLAVDKARNIGNAQAKAQAPRVMQNLLQYAQAVSDGTVAPIILYQNPLLIAITDYQDTWTNTKGLGQTLTDLGYGYTDLTAGLLAGGAVNLTGYNTFMVGSHTAQNTTLRAALSAAKTTMNSFVGSGGAVIMLTQADQNRANEDWLQAPANVIRGDPDFDAVVQIQSGHQLFHQPNLITNNDLSGWQYVTWPTSWESFVTFQNVGVLAGNQAGNPTLAAMIESGWGYGRALLTSLAPDKARNIGNAQGKAQAPRWMQNALQYAADVQNGNVQDVVIYQGGSYAGAIAGVVYEDLDGNGARDVGEPGIGGVGVSDTVDLVLTAPDGTYTLPNTANSATLVYISIPAGYAKTAHWYHAINASSSGPDFRFAVTAADETAPFEFIQVTDTHIGGSGNRALYADAIARMGLLTNPPEFLVATGDLTNSGADTTQYEDYVAAVATSRVPVFNVFGNHDQNSSTTENYRRYLGPDYYSFNYGNCHFLVVNSVYPTARQSAWMTADLAQLRGSRKLFIFQHYSPSQSEHNQFAGYQADAVFSGHWHSHHSVMSGSLRSYNSPNLLFGGIDCSPASFKVISVNGSNVTTHVRYLADGKRLQIISPNDSVLVPRTGLHVAVNAYETSADISGVSFTIKRGGAEVVSGTLTREGDWSWTHTLSQIALAAGPYTITVTATNDQGQSNTASANFTVLNRRMTRPTTVGNWSQFGGGPRRGGLATGATISPPLGINWMSHTGGTIDFASPVLDQETLFVGVKDRGDFVNNGVLALRTSDGSKKWFTWTPAAVSHSVAVDGSRVYAASHGGLLHVLTQATGQQLQQKTLGSAIQRFLYGAPVVYSNRVYAGTYAYFAAFDAGSGAEQWHQSYGADWISSNAAPATDGNTVVVPANWATNSLRAVAATDGHTFWEFATQGLHGSPVIAGDRVVFTTYDSKITAVALSTGTQIWSMSLGGRSATTPAISGNTVVAGGTGAVKAFRLDNGGALWTFNVGTSPLRMSPYNATYASLVGSPTILGSSVYVPAGDGRLYALDLNTGSTQWSMAFGTPILSAPCISGNTLFLTTYDGHVYALSDGNAFTSPADFDGDTDVDQADVDHFLACATGTDLGPPAAGCADADLDGDQDIDPSDFGTLQQCLSGENHAADPACAD